MFKPTYVSINFLVLILVIFIKYLLAWSRQDTLSFVRILKLLSLHSRMVKWFVICILCLSALVLRVNLLAVSWRMRMSDLKLVILSLQILCLVFIIVIIWILMLNLSRILIWLLFVLL